jgi:general secretion pathway protein M
MNVNLREKKFLLLTVAIGCILLLYYYVVEPIIESQQRISTELTSNISKLNQDQLKVNRQQKLERKVKQAEQEFSELKAGLLPGNKAPLAAAELQKIIKSIVKEQGVGIISEKVLDPLDMGIYQRIAVQVTVRCLTTELKKIIYLIETNKMMLSIPQINIKLVNMRNPKDIQATILVQGAIHLGEE